MPISRYEIRNEYGLADPDLYRTADTDDPEAVLEGVAMAGLVGVLRQLGDLAEFAADIFHNLHEEVVATTARGHGLMIRVQQLETEIPKIEMTFLSQTDHSAFFNHTGVGWHSNLRVDQNLVTQGDLPRLVMDSYEECRPPPRLFLLDKFDVAGAGACLKRYSDPSFFKVENSGMNNADVVPREKKNRKVKKKGSRWKNGETNEVLPTSHTKLHQLFMEEARIENGVSNPILRAKLKRRLNGFPFNKKNGKSYMEKFLESTSPDNKEVHEIDMNPSPLVSAAYDYNESGIKVVEVRQVSPHRENVGRKRSPPSFSDREKIMVKSTIDDKIHEVPNLYCGISSNVGISSTPNEKIIVMDSYTEGSLIGYQSDDTVSEVDSYIDASSTVVSDTYADSRLRVKRDIIPSHVKSDSLISDANSENLQTRSFDSQSTGDSTMSDEGNNSSRKGMSSFSSDSPATSVGNPQFKTVSTRGLSTPIVEDFPVEDKHSESVVSADPCPSTDAITNQKSDYEHVTSESTVAGKCMVEGTNTDKSESTLDDENKGSNLVMDPPCSPGVYDAELHSEDGTKSNGKEVTEISGSANLKSLNDVRMLSKEDKSNTADVISAVPALSDNASTGHNVTEKSDSADLISPNEVHILLDESNNSTSADWVSHMPALSDNLIMDDIPSQIGPTKLEEEEIHSSEDSGLDELDNGNNPLLESHGELILTEKVDQTKPAKSGFQNNYYPESEVSGSTVPISHFDVEATYQGLERALPEKTQPRVEQSLFNGDQEISRQSNLGNHVSDYEVEEAIVPEETGLHSREKSFEGPPVLPINNQQLPDPLGSIHPPSNPLSGTNLADLPPLPPLPPTQWMMMRKLRLGSSSQFPQLLSQSAGSTDDDNDASFRFSPLTASSNNDTANVPTSKEKLQLGLVSTEGDVTMHTDAVPQLVSHLIVSIDEMKNSPIQLPVEPTLKYEKATSSRVELNSMHKDKTTLKEEKAESCHVELNSMHEDKTTLKEEKAESSRVEVYSMNNTVDLPPKNENNQQSAMPGEEDEVANDSRVVKLPRPRNPLIDEVTALDKSRLRKVTERFRPPQLQKVDERNSLLEQIKTKSFKLKPALLPRPNIRGPSTNLRVAAIVEKANAIRQALADSDEDDDSWSDS